MLLRTVVACLAVLLAQPARAFETLAGELTAARSCEAYVSFRKRTNPDGARLEPGTAYRVLGRNEPGGPWLQIELPQGEPRQRWVDAGCGAIAGTAPAPAARSSGLLPFFDDRNEGRDDPAPPPPPLDAFDRAVLGLCGDWGSRPRARDFRAMLDEPELGDTVATIYEALDRGIRGRDLPLKRFKDELTAVWFDARGFEHVFCGEPEADGLGGLHYRGRYLELQEQGIAGAMTERDCRATAIEPPVYTVGVRYRPPGGGGLRSACPKGYAYDLGAADLLYQATAAYKELRRQRGAEMCLDEVQGPSGDGYLAVVVVRRDAIRTFYPDVSPSCDGGLGPSACACGG